jgi:hypothetical protein
MCERKNRVAECNFLIERGKENKADKEALSETQ